MNPLDRWLASMEGRELDRPPVCCMTTSANLDQMEAVGVYWPEAHSDPGLMTDLALAANRVVGFESVRIPFCLTVEAEILGAEVDLTKVDRNPMIKGHPFDEETVDQIEVPDDVMERGRAKVVKESTEILKERVGGELPIVVGSTGPFTLASHLVGAENLLLWIVTNPDAVHQALRGATEMVERFNRELDSLGVDAIQQSDPSASTDMLSGEMFDEFAAPYIRRSFEGVENAKSVLHICGNTTPLLEHMIATGVDGLSIEEKVDPQEAVDIVNGRAALVGNIGIVKPLLQGTPYEVREDTMRVCEAGFNVVNPGCGMAAKVPNENLRAMVEAVRSFGK
ncbi:MAG: MtaA/CmuA family methyltransferase [Methanomassiliicoccales archaeon]